MIISASRRTDIPAFYADWFFNRLREGTVYSRNPFNGKLLPPVSLRPSDVDCIVFWTKNPGPMINRLELLEPLPYYFQVTVNPYDAMIEKAFGGKDQILDAITELSGMIGPDRVVWRYDPVFVNERYTPDFHIRAFADYARRLERRVNRCIISFVDEYRSISTRMAGFDIVPVSMEDILSFARAFSGICRESGMEIFSCAEPHDLAAEGVRPASCIDPVLISKITGREMAFEKDRNQRKECGCAKSVDIGAYDTCPGGCAYCYANRREASLARNLRNYDPDSPVLCGNK
ncbi:MAG: DUF1848 domain-containing protein [Clostridia bacterium]